MGQPGVPGGDHGCPGTGHDDRVRARHGSAEGHDADRSLRAGRDLSYNGAGQLASITHVLGLTSAFGYGPNDFVSSLTTPYGTTTFRHETDALNQYNLRFIEATDPLGGTERAEFQWQTPSLAVTAPAAEVPAGFAGWNTSRRMCSSSPVEQFRPEATSNTRTQACNAGTRVPVS